MSLANRRWNAQRDANEPDIVDAIEAAGCQVWRELPVDLLVRVPRDPPGVLRTLEVKVLQGKRNPKVVLDKRKVAQAEFCRDTGTAYVTSAEQALEALGLASGGRVVVEICGVAK